MVYFCVMWTHIFKNEVKKLVCRLGLGFIMQRDHRAVIEIRIINNK